MNTKQRLLALCPEIRAIWIWHSRFIRQNHIKFHYEISWWLWELKASSFFCMCTIMYYSMGHMGAQIVELCPGCIQGPTCRIKATSPSKKMIHYQTESSRSFDQCQNLNGTVDFKGNISTNDWRVGSGEYRSPAVMQYPWFLLLLFYVKVKLRSIVHNNSYMVDNRT